MVAGDGLLVQGGATCYIARQIPNLGKGVPTMSNTVFQSHRSILPQGSLPVARKLSARIQCDGVSLHRAHLRLHRFQYSRAYCTRHPAAKPSSVYTACTVCPARPHTTSFYVNGTHLAKLLNSEYAFTEVPPGTVVISGLPKEYYGSVIMSAAAAANKSQAERKRAGPV